MIYGARNFGMESMVLWDPIAKGSTYIRELEGIYAEFLRPSSNASEGSGAAEPHSGILGLPPADSLFCDLGGIDLSTIAPAPARSILLVESIDDGCSDSLRGHLGGLVPRFDYRHFPGAAFRTPEINKVMFANQIIDTVVSWISTTCP